MLIDAHDLDDGTLLEADVCVMGGGAAGISLAWALRDSGRSVLLLESGHFIYDQRVQALYLGEESGDLLEPEALYLGSTRLRYFGGTTNHWNGWCRPLDAIDYEDREWLPAGARGWPLESAELDPYYRGAAQLAEISPFDERAEVPALGRRQLFEEPADFESVRFHISRPTRFGQRYRSDLESARSTRVVLNANAVEIVADADARHATEVRIACLDGRRHRARARAFVLATGAIENARLLLASRGSAAAGLGNDHDLVGRYFMEHPRVRVGSLAAPGLRTFGRPFIHAFGMDGGGHEARLALHLAESTQRRERLLKATVVLGNLSPGERPPLAKAVARLADRDGRGEQAAPLLTSLLMTAEQTPNPESRVRLSDESDALGMPRSRLEWRLRPQDGESAVRAVELLSREIERRSLGRTRVRVSENDPWPGASGSPHQMGTTRMSRDPRRGVVDVDSRVHGVDNLYVAGSSVFPTSGATNPTFTILALTLRLADHLRKVLA